MGFRSTVIFEFAPVAGLILLIGMFVLLKFWLRNRKVIGDHRDILDQQSQPIVRIDIDLLEPRLCNRAFSKLMGYAGNAECISLFNQNPHLPQQNIYQIYRLSVEDRTPDILIQDCHGNGVLHYVTVHINQESESMDLVLHPKAQAEGAHTKLSPSGARKATTDSLVSDEEFMESTSLVELLNPELGVWEIDLLRGTYIHNDTWLKYLGYQNDEDNDQFSFWQSVTAPEDALLLTEAINGAEGGFPFSVTIRLGNRDGVELTVETRGVVLSRDEEGAPRLVRGTHCDITAQDAGEGQPAGAAPKEDIDRHELMNQMAAILGYAELIVDTDNSGEETKEFAREVLKSAQRARQLVLPNENKNDAGSSWLRAVALKHGFNILGEPWMPGRLETGVIETAIDHVVKFMDLEGCPGLQRKIELGEVAQNVDRSCSACPDIQGSENYSITLATPDLKFSKEHFRHLLNPGYSTTQFAIENNLLLASNLLHEMGGHIHVAMVDDEFSVSLLVSTDYKSGLDKSDPVGVFESTRAVEIMIVDDELSVARYLKQVLERAGFSSTIVNDPLVALEKFREDPQGFNLVITDQSMPGMTGVDLIGAMRAQRPDLPVIVCTGHSEAVYADAVPGPGAVVFLTKPINVPMLIQTIRESLPAQ